jgi:hypothetical protein
MGYNANSQLGIGFASQGITVKIKQITLVIRLSVSAITPANLC